jgi:hypothetical protein
MIIWADKKMTMTGFDFLWDYLFIYYWLIYFGAFLFLSCCKSNGFALSYHQSKGFLLPFLLLLENLLSLYENRQFVVRVLPICSATHCVFSQAMAFVFFRKKEAENKRK